MRGVPRQSLLFLVDLVGVVGRVVEPRVQGLSPPKVLVDLAVVAEVLEFLQLLGVFG